MAEGAAHGAPRTVSGHGRQRQQLMRLTGAGQTGGGAGYDQLASPLPGRSRRLCRRHCAVTVVGDRNRTDEPIDGGRLSRGVGTIHSRPVWHSVSACGARRCEAMPRVLAGDRTGRSRVARILPSLSADRSYRRRPAGTIAAVTKGSRARTSGSSKTGGTVPAPKVRRGRLSPGGAAAQPISGQCAPRSSLGHGLLFARWGLRSGLAAGQ